MNNASASAPRVSVIVRTTDRPTLLGEAIESLRRQTFGDFEVVLVDDGKTPPPEEILSPAPGRGLVRVSGGGQGRAHALNAGLAAARGAYVAYLDDDDLYESDHLETLVRFLEGSDEYKAAYTDAILVSQTLGADGRYHETARRPAFGVDFDPTRLLYANTIPLICLMHERALAEAAGGFDPSFDLFEDWDFLIRLAAVTRFHRIPRATALYRVRDDRTNATRARPWHGAASQSARERLYERHWSRRSPKTDVAFLDIIESERGALEWEIAEVRRVLDGERAARTSVESALAELRREDEALEIRLTNLEAELKSVRADAARQLAASGERERAAAAERDAIGVKLDAVHRSLAWRLFAPWWKLKALLRR